MFRVLIVRPWSSLEARLFSSQKLLSLNEISNLNDATKVRRRWGRGPGSGRGKLCGYGHQKSRSTPRAFEGGQTPLFKSLPKIGFHNHGYVITWTILY